MGSREQQTNRGNDRSIAIRHSNLLCASAQLVVLIFNIVDIWDRSRHPAVPSR
jgi:hypothetical protein